MVSDRKTVHESEKQLIQENQFCAEQENFEPTEGLPLSGDLDLELIMRLRSNLVHLTEITDRLGFMIREIQYLTR